MIRGIVFDFDGTLVASNQIKRQVFFELAGEFKDGVRMMQEVMMGAAGRDRYWIFERFAAAMPLGVDARSLADRYTQICQDRIASAPEVQGTLSSLERLRAEGKLSFINSATPLEPLTMLVRLRRLETLFDGIYGSPATKYENLEAIRLRHGLARMEILVVGDGESDRESAEALGCHFVAVKSAENDFAAEPLCCIPDLTGLPDIILANS